MRSSRMSEDAPRVSESTRSAHPGRFRRIRKIDASSGSVRFVGGVTPTLALIRAQSPFWRDILPVLPPIFLGKNYADVACQIVHVAIAVHSVRGFVSTPPGKFHQAHERI